MRSARIASGVISVALSAALPARAALMNGGFETGDLSNWSVTGTVFASDVEQPRDFLPPAIADWTATEGTYFAAVWSTDSAGVVNSELSQTFVASADEVLKFDYFFDYGDVPPLADVGMAVLTLPDLTTVRLFGFNTVPGPQLAPGENILWTSIDFVMPFDGEYTLTFLATDADGSFESIVGVDNVRILPEPSGAALAFIAALLLGRRRLS